MKDSFMLVVGLHEDSKRECNKMYRLWRLSCRDVVTEDYIENCYMFE